MKVWIEHDDGHAGGYPHYCERCHLCERPIAKFLGNWIHEDTRHPRCHPEWRARP